MSPFVLHLQSGDQYENIEDVVSFSGRDISGSFGIMAGHERMMTILAFGLAHFRRMDGMSRYIALPGGVLYFVENALFISTRRYVRGDDYTTVAAAISGVLAQEEENLHDIKSSIARMEQEMTHRLWELQRERV